MPRPIIICPKCRKKKEYHAKGMCNTCYKRYSWKPKLKKCPRCKRMMPIHAKGYCRGCYTYIFHYEEVRIYTIKKLYNISLEVYKKATKKCIVCGFDKVVELHHIDNNHENTSPSNFIGLCPNHHRMLHKWQYKEKMLKRLENAAKM